MAEDVNRVSTHIDLSFEERVVRVVTVVAIVCAVLCLGSAAGCARMPAEVLRLPRLRLPGWYLLWQAVLSRIPFVRLALVLATSMRSSTWVKWRNGQVRELCTELLGAEKKRSSNNRGKRFTKRI
jgi:hypothetical protein